MKLTVAGLQSAGSPGDVRANLAELDAAAGDAVARGAALLITDEMFVTGYDIGEAVHELARLDLVDRVAEICRRHSLAVLVGLPEVDAEHVYNSVFLLDASGNVVARHRKSHLYGDLDRRYYTPGPDAVTIVDFAGVRLGLMICYDVEFPENVRAAALAGAHALLVPTAQMEPFSFIADIVIRTRAWENQLYVAYVNHIGTEGSTTYVGRSSIVGPDAGVLDSLGTDAGLIVATIDTDVIDRARVNNPYLTDRRPELYGSLDQS